MCAQQCSSIINTTRGVYSRHWEIGQVRVETRALAKTAHRQNTQKPFVNSICTCLAVSLLFSILSGEAILIISACYRIVLFIKLMPQRKEQKIWPSQRCDRRARSMVTSVYDWAAIIWPLHPFKLSGGHLTSTGQFSSVPGRHTPRPRCEWQTIVRCCIKTCWTFRSWLFSPDPPCLYPNSGIFSAHRKSVWLASVALSAGARSGCQSVNRATNTVEA